MYRFLIIFLLSVLSCSGLAAQTGNDTDTLDIDALQHFEPGEEPESETAISDTNAKYRNFFLSPDTLRAWKNADMYAWIKEIENTLKSAAEKGSALPKAPKKILIKKNGKGTSSGGVSSTRSTPPNSSGSVSAPGFLKPLLWIIAGGIILFIIIRLFLNGGIFTGGRSRKKNVNAEASEDQHDEEENISDKDFEALKRRALKDNNYRLATRYMFLSVLRDLNNRERIRYSVEKTNSMYMRELPQQLQNGFASVSLYYEYVWYGNVSIDREVFDRVEQSFEQFSRTII